MEKTLIPVSASFPEMLWLASLFVSLFLHSFCLKRLQSNVGHFVVRSVSQLVMRTEPLRARYGIAVTKVKGLNPTLGKPARLQLLNYIRSHGCVPSLLPEKHSI